MCEADMGDMTDVTLGRREAVAGLAGLATILVLVAADLLLDARAGTSWHHLLTEIAVLLAAAAGSALVVRRLLRTRAEAARLARDLDAARRDAARWREETHSLLAGLGQAMDRQFERWRLTPAEREVGLLLLKGLSHRDVGRVRHTTERTVRQQARSLYAKAGLGSRSALSAFFFEDLLLPHGERG